MATTGILPKRKTPVPSTGRDIVPVPLSHPCHTRRPVEHRKRPRDAGPFLHGAVRSRRRKLCRPEGLAGCYRAFLATSVMAVNAAGSLTAMSDSTLRSSCTPAFLRPFMSTE